MHINEVLNNFWKEHGKIAINVPDIQLRKIIAAEKHPIYGWETETQWYCKMIRQERELYANEY